MRKAEAAEGGNTMATEGGTFFPKVSAIDVEISAEALAGGIRGGRLRPGEVVVSMSTKDCPSAYPRNNRAMSCSMYGRMELVVPLHLSCACDL
jgi:hypothetical protein